MLTILFDQSAPIASAFRSELSKYHNASLDRVSYAVSQANDESRSKSNGANKCPDESVTGTCQPNRSSTRALSTAAAGVMRAGNVGSAVFERLRGTRILAS